MLRQLCLLVFLSMIFRLLEGYDCQPAQSQDNITSGTHVFLQSDTTQVLLYYSMPLDGASQQNFRMAVSIKHFGGYTPQKGASFSVTEQKQIGTANVLLILTVQENLRWNFLIVSYLASWGDSVILGAQTVSHFLNSPIISQNNGVQARGISIPVSLNRNKKYQVQTFISGVKIISVQFDINIYSQVISQNNTKIKLELTTSYFQKIVWIKFQYAIYEVHASSRFVFGVTEKPTYSFAGPIKIQKSELIIKMLNICRPKNIIRCKENQNYSLQTKQCECNQGFKDSFDVCIICDKNQAFDKLRKLCIKCPPNSISDASKQSCRCIEGFQLSKDSRSCVLACRQNQIAENNSCVCINGAYIIQDKCTVCSPDSFYNGSKCICKNGFYGNGRQCRKCNPLCQTCQSMNICLSCLKRYKLQNGKCVLQSSCKGQGQIFDLDMNKCTCQANYIRVNQTCRQCPRNSRANNNKTICQCDFPAIFSLKSFSCIRCSDNSFFDFDQSQCECIDGFQFDENKKCVAEKVKVKQCNEGQFFDNGVCMLCSQFCRLCQDNFNCQECKPGFIKEQLNIFGIQTSICTSLCGDSKQNQVEECDDGNKEDGDGCSALCEIQDQWSCYGGSQISESTCQEFSAGRIYITLGRNGSFAGRSVQQVFLSSIPDCFQDCTDCDKLLKVQILQSPFPMSVKVSHQQKAQFLVQFLYQGKLLRNPFKFIIKLNDNLPDKYKDCLSAQDLQPQFIQTINPAQIRQQAIFNS